MISKKRFFKDKLEGTEKAIWEQEYKMIKAKKLREEVRQERDRFKEQEAKLTDYLKTATGKDAQQFSEELDKVKVEVKKYEAQMQMVDDQINGIPANGDDPGEDGIIDLMAVLTQRKESLKDYIRTL